MIDFQMGKFSSTSFLQEVVSQVNNIASEVMKTFCIFLSVMRASEADINKRENNQEEEQKRRRDSICMKRATFVTTKTGRMNARFCGAISRQSNSFLSPTAGPLLPLLLSMAF